VLEAVIHHRSPRRDSIRCIATTTLHVLIRWMTWPMHTTSTLMCRYTLVAVKSPLWCCYKHGVVQECLRFGRPNLRAMFSHMRGIAAEAGDDRVAVLGCGPHGLLSELRKLSWSESKDGVAFDYHGETFDF